MHYFVFHITAIVQGRMAGIVGNDSDIFSVLLYSSVWIKVRLKPFVPGVQVLLFEAINQGLLWLLDPEI
jgi:hypothetical protein